MFDKPTAVHTMGLELGQSLVRSAVLSFHKNQPKLDSFFEIPLAGTPSPNNVNQLYIDDSQKQMESLEKNHLVVSTLSASEVLIRPMELKIKKEKDIDAVISFQAEPLLPYPVENAVLDRISLLKTKEGTLLTVIATRKDYLAQHIDQWKSLGINPEVISAVPAALTQFANQFAKEQEILFVLHLGAAQTVCVIVNTGKLIAAQAIPQGIDHLVEELAKDKDAGTAAARLEFNQMNFNLPLKEENSHFAAAIDALRLEITKVVYALAKQTKGKEINTLLLTGEGASIDKLPALLCRNLNKTLINPTENPAFPASVADLQKYAIPLGAALSALPKTQDQINFRQGDYAYPNPWKRLKKPLIIYTAACLLVAAALYFFGTAYLSYREAEFKQQYLELLNVMNKPYSLFEREFTDKFPSERPRIEEITPLQNLTQEDLTKRLQFLKKEIQASPQLFPLMPNLPLVSDVLAWISTNPNFVGQNDAENNLHQSLQLESLSYQMVKRPDLTKKQEKYQVKVEIEFTSPNPKMAREFHDALIAPNEIVDPKGEIKWSSNRDRYRASFFLKDKTTYPSL